MGKRVERGPRDLDELVAMQGVNMRRAERGGRPGRQRRMKDLLECKVELFLGFHTEVPSVIKRMVGGRLSLAAQMMLWILPTDLLWRDDGDPARCDGKSLSPMEMWNEKRYREQIEDYFRVMADNLSPIAY